ncbi:MAG: 50S ribosomal protein L29 [Desulfuromonas sp.]|nr:MAG: 50S ribosomal protein L29 [Desulfuromonas sp.]
MKASEVKGLSIDELQKKCQELNQELFSVKFQLHTGHLENTARLSQLKKDIARVQTVLREKQA